MEELEFKINDYITCKLEDGYRTSIFIKGEYFEHCKFLLIIDPQEHELHDDIDSIDEAAAFLSKELETELSLDDLNISYEEEYWAHCSNLQAWAEHGYDTRLLHSNLAFPLLKKLADVGDLQAKKIFKVEVAYRFSSQFIPVIIFLVDGHYLEVFTEEEKNLLFDELIQNLENPNSRLYQYNLPKMFMNLGNSFRFKQIYHMAKSFLNKAFELDNNNLDALNDLGIVYEQNGKYQKSIECYEKIIEIDPEYKYAWYNIGISADYVGDIDRSIKAYKKAIEIDPEYNSAWNNLGYMYNNAGEPRKAIEALKAVLEKSGDNADALNNMGIAYFYLGDLENAKKYYLKTITIDENYNLAWSNLSELYDIEENWKKSYECSKKALELNENNYEANFFHARACFKLSYFDVAEKYYKKALIIDKDKKQHFDLNDYRVLYNLAEFYISKGKKSKALEALNKSLEMNPDYDEALRLEQKLKQKI
ncbi:MAG: tetratricopeptide repeat protein [Promethearchaeota archaeon]